MGIDIDFTDDGRLVFYYKGPKEHQLIEVPDAIMKKLRRRVNRRLKEERYQGIEKWWKFDYDPDYGGASIILREQSMTWTPLRVVPHLLLILKTALAMRGTPPLTFGRARNAYFDDFHAGTMFVKPDKEKGAVVQFVHVVTEEHYDEIATFEELTISDLDNFTIMDKIYDLVATKRLILGGKAK